MSIRGTQFLTTIPYYIMTTALTCLSIQAGEPTKVAWKKEVLDTHFRSEGVAVADVNRDGKKDVLNGEYWYEAPDWKPHELQPPMDFKDGLSNYSRSFACWTEDFNSDGFLDLIVIDFPRCPLLLDGESERERRALDQAYNLA